MPSPDTNGRDQPLTSASPMHFVGIPRTLYYYYILQPPTYFPNLFLISKIVLHYCKIYLAFVQRSEIRQIQLPQWPCQYLLKALETAR